MSYGDNFSELEGKTLVRVHNNGSDVLTFECEDGTEYYMQHIQDCCESVVLEEIIGDLDDLLNTPILYAAEISNAEDESLPAEALNGYEESYTWTFYRITTIKGTVTLRWYGCSNGYYSESVSFGKTRSGY